MHILHDISFNNAETTVHRIIRAEVIESCYVTISSYADVDATNELYVASYTAPMSALDGDGGFYETLYEWAVSAEGPFNGGVIAEDLSPLVKLQTSRKLEINAIRDTNIALGCVTEFGIVDMDEISIRNILGASQIGTTMKLLQQPFSINWKYQDNSVHVLNSDQMIAIGMMAMKHVSDCYGVSWALKDAIDAADTVEEINEIDTDTPWTELVTSPHYVPPEEEE